MALFKKNSTPPDWPPDDPRKSYADSLALYNHSINKIYKDLVADHNAGMEYVKNNPHLLQYQKPEDYILPTRKDAIRRYNDLYYGDYIYKLDNIEKNKLNANTTLLQETHPEGEGSGYLKDNPISINKGYVLNSNIKPTRMQEMVQYYGGEETYNLPPYTAIPLYKKPTGNALRQPIPTMPILPVSGSTPSSALQKKEVNIKPPQVRTYMNYPQIGLIKTPDGRDVIFDKLGRTDETVEVPQGKFGQHYYTQLLWQAIQRSNQNK